LRWTVNWYKALGLAAFAVAVLCFAILLYHLLYGGK
jgi:hypothetical protein